MHTPQEDPRVLSGTKEREPRITACLFGFLRASVMTRAEPVRVLERQRNLGERGESQPMMPGRPVER